MRYPVEITLNEIIAAYNFHVWGAPRKRQRGLILFFLVFAILWIIGLDALLRREVSFSFLFCWFPPLIMIVAMIIHVFPLWVIKKSYKQNKMRKSGEYEFTEEKLCAYSDYGNIAIPWADFRKWKESEKMFLIYTTNHNYNIIPKRIFTTPDEEQALRTILTHALGPAK